MSTSDDSLEQLRRHREALKQQLDRLGDLRPGSLVERYRRCGKPNCHCVQPGHAGHGPSYSLTHAVEGKTVTRVIPAAAVERTREQIDAYQEFRRWSREFVETSERLCDAQLTAGPEATSTGAAKKGGSKKASTRRSSPKSRR